MNFFGMGFLEMAFVLVVALLILGPNKMMEFARTMGKYIHDFQRAASEIPRLLSLEEERPRTQPPHRQQLPEQPVAEEGEAVEEEQSQANTSQRQQPPRQLPAEERDTPTSV